MISGKWDIMFQCFFNLIIKSEQNYHAFISDLCFFFYKLPFSEELSASVAQMVKNLPSMQESWVGEDPWEEGMGTHSSCPCLENRHGQRRLVGPIGCKESDMTERLTTRVEGTFPDFYIKIPGSPYPNCKKTEC